jgi:hypothetical protein
MIQGRGGSGFQFEAAEMIGIFAGSGPDELERYVALKAFVARPEDFAHGSGADLLDDAVVTYDSVRHCENAPLGW